MRPSKWKGHLMITFGVESERKKVGVWLLLFYNKMWCWMKGEKRMRTARRLLSSKFPYKCLRRGSMTESHFCMHGIGMQWIELAGMVCKYQHAIDVNPFLVGRWTPVNCYWDGRHDSEGLLVPVVRIARDFCILTRAIKKPSQHNRARSFKCSVVCKYEK